MQRITLETVQFSKLLEIDDVEPISDKDYQVLSEVSSILRKFNYTDRFGVCLLHKHFDVNDDEMLIETTDEEARISSIMVEKANKSKVGIIETMWKFKDNSVKAETVCVLRCRGFSIMGHKREHVKESR